MSIKEINRKRKLNFQSILEAKKKAKNLEQPESAEVQKCKSATDENLAFSDAESEDVASIVDDVLQTELQESVEQTAYSDDVVRTIPPVPVVPSPESGTVPASVDELKDFFNKMHGLARRFESIIPNTNNNRFVDIDDPKVMEALSRIMSKVCADNMEMLLKKRREDIEESLKQKRQELQIGDKIVVLEDDQLAFAATLVGNALGLYNDLYKRNESWSKEVREYKKVKSHLHDEIRNGLIVLDRRDQKLYAYIDKLCAGQKASVASEKPSMQRPARPSSDSVGQMFYYLLVLLPLYKIRCFLTDRHTLAFFHTVLFSTIIMLLGLIGLMARDLAGYKTDARKYYQIRAWSYVDSTDIYGKCMYMDALYANPKMNAERIESDKAFIKKKVRDKKNGHK